MALAMVEVTITLLAIELGFLFGRLARDRTQRILEILELDFYFLFPN